MKAKKGIKRLHRVDTLLGSVIEQYAASTPELHELLDGARSSIASAAEALVAAPAKKPAAKALTNRHHASFPISARKRLSVAAKKRWADAKKGFEDASRSLREK